MGYGNWLHGEAVAAGMVRRRGRRNVSGSLVLPKRSVLNPAQAGWVTGQWAARNVRAGYLPHMLRDKKVLAGEMRLILRWQLVRVKFAAAFRTSLFLRHCRLSISVTTRKVRPLIKRLLASG